MAVALLLTVTWLELSMETILVPAGKLAFVIDIPTKRPWTEPMPVMSGDPLVVVVVPPVAGPVPVLAL